MSRSTRRCSWAATATRTFGRDALLKLLTHAVYFPVRLGTKAGVQDCHPHRFRHTFAVNSLRNGGNAFESQMLAGEVALFALQTCDRNRTLALQKPDHRRHGVLRGK